MLELNLILVSPGPELCLAWENRFRELPNVSVFHGRFEDVPEYDCMVSPANSFGLMDGGVDAAITSFFGDQLMYRVQDRVLAEFLGEQPVGTCIIVETMHPKHPYLAHAPTMRSPMEIKHTDNAYLAMWALFLAVYRHNSVRHDIKTILCPGLGTGTGQVAPMEAARQMALAYKHYLKPPEAISWTLASDRQQTIRYGGDFGFHIPEDMILDP